MPLGQERKVSAQRPQCASVPRRANTREEVGGLSGESQQRWSQTLIPDSPPPPPPPSPSVAATLQKQKKTNLSSDEVELCVALHTSRALGRKEKQDITQGRPVGSEAFQDSGAI